jgi:hypothetical protein
MSLGIKPNKAYLALITGIGLESHENKNPSKHNVRGIFLAKTFC